MYDIHITNTNIIHQNASCSSHSFQPELPNTPEIPIIEGTIIFYLCLVWRGLYIFQLVLKLNVFFLIVTFLNILASSSILWSHLNFNVIYNNNEKNLITQNKLGWISVSKSFFDCLNKLKKVSLSLYLHISVQFSLLYFNSPFVFFISPLSLLFSLFLLFSSLYFFSWIFLIFSDDFADIWKNYLPWIHSYTALSSSTTVARFFLFLLYSFFFKYMIQLGDL